MLVFNHLKKFRRYIDVNDIFHTVKRWKNIHESVKLININDEVVLSPMRQYSLGRQIHPIILWPFIVQKCHVSVNGKH
jgi:hypothetical protein